MVDDGSTDGGPDLVRALNDEHIRLVCQANAGVSAARNMGIEHARADLIAFLDADDLWLPEFLANVLALQADFSEAKWFATGYEIRPAHGTAFASRLRGMTSNFKRGILANYFRVASFSDPPVWTSATAVKRDAIQAIGGFPVGIGSGEDLLTWARLAVRYPLAYEAKTQAVFMVSGIDRRPDVFDHVASELKALMQAHPSTLVLSDYLGLWYRMQSVMAMRFNDAALARQRAWLAVRYAPLQLRNVYTLLMAWLPVSMRAALESSARKLLNK